MGRDIISPRKLRTSIFLENSSTSNIGGLKLGNKLYDTVPISVVEPSAEAKQRCFVELVRDGVEEPTVTQTKLRLGQVRDRTLNNISGLAKEFLHSVAQYKNVRSYFARDAVDAIEYISNFSEHNRTIATGLSSTVNELRPALRDKGCIFLDSYSTQFTSLVDIGTSNGNNSPLSVKVEPAAWKPVDLDRKLSTGSSLKNVSAVLGVNAAAANDGSVFLVQHSSNIGALLSQARNVFLIVGLEKIVSTPDDALFQAKCAAAFGAETILFDLSRLTRRKVTSLALTDLPEAVNSNQETHIILLDNGRTTVARGKYREMLRCIGCRSCANHCPAYHYLDDFTSYPRECLWCFLVRINRSIESCGGCGMCRSDCPLSIDIPMLVSQAKAEYSPKSIRKISSRVLYNVPRMALLGSLFAPLAKMLLRSRPLRLLMERLLGLDRRRAFPEFRHETFEHWFRARHG